MNIITKDYLETPVANLFRVKNQDALEYKFS